MTFLSVAGVALHEPRVLRAEPLEMTGVAPCDIPLGEWTEVQMQADALKVTFTREGRGALIPAGYVVDITDVLERFVRVTR